MSKGIVFGLLALIACKSFSQSKSKEIEQLRKIANENELRAKKAEEDAQKYNREAQDARMEADRQRYLAVAVALSRKSLEIEDKSLATLLALQAFNFSRKYGGYEHDNDIYNGLLTALSGFGDNFQKLGRHDQPMQALVARPESMSVLSLGQDGKLIRWTNQNTEWSGSELVPARDGYAVYGADLSSTRPWVIGGRKLEGGRFGIYDLTYSLRKIDGLESEIIQIKFLPEAKGFYALANSGNSIFLSDLKNTEELIKIPERISLMDLNREGNKLAGATSDGKIFIWDVENNHSISAFQIGSDNNSITAIAITPRGRDIVVGNEKGEIKIVSADNGVVRKILVGRYARIEKIVFSNTGRFMAVLDKKNAIRVFNLADLNKWPQVIGEKNSVGSLTFSPDDTQLFCSINEKEPSIHVWSLRSENIARELCVFLKRNMTKDEWDSYVGDIMYEATCVNLPRNDK